MLHIELFFYCEVGLYQYNVFRSGGNESILLRIQYTYLHIINCTFPDIKILSKILLQLNLGLVCISRSELKPNHHLLLSIWKLFFSFFRCSLRNWCEEPEKPGTKDVSRVIYAPNAWILPCCVNEKAKFIAKLVTEKISGRQDLDLVWVQWLANNKKKPKRYKKRTHHSLA